MAAALFLGGLAFLLAVVWGGPLIRLLRAKRIGKQIRIEGPQTHQVKMGTPTMGGLMIVVPVVVITGVVTLINVIVEMYQGRPIANIGQQIQRGDHRGRAGIVRIIENHRAVGAGHRDESQLGAAILQPLQDMIPRHALGQTHSGSAQ